MELRNQLIRDIEILPEDAVRAISLVVKQFVVFANKSEAVTAPIRKPFPYDCMKGQIYVPDDFNDPMEEFGEYM